MKRPLIVRSLPRRLRARYGEEIVALLAESDRPIADRLDVAKLGSRWHLEAIMGNVWRTSAMVLALVSVFALGYAINGLAEGVTELPKHWWSAAPVLGLALAGLAGLIGRGRARKGAGR
ncbi:MAG: hypothetical protein ACRDJ1_05300 [Actinomycetota bacterium]